MSNHIKGEESLLFIKGKDDLFFRPVCCLISNNFSENVETINTTTRENNGWKTTYPTTQSYSIAVDAVMIEDGVESGSSAISYRELRKMKRNKELIDWYVETLKGWYVDSGKAHITEISDSNAVGDDIGFSATLEGFGKPLDGYGQNFIYSDEITYNFTYSHEPENEINEGDWFLTNSLYVNYYNAFGILYDCDLRFILTKVPAKGFLAHNVTRQIFKVGDIISYCDKDNFTYFPNGFDNDLGVSGNYSETFSYKIIDQKGRHGRETTHTILMTDSAAPEIEISVAITWADGSSAPMTGHLGSIGVRLDSLVFDPLNPIVTQTWEIFDGTNWIFYKEKTTDTEIIPLNYLENKIRLKVVAQFGEIVTSNVLTYTKEATANIYITDINYGSPYEVDRTYKLHVEGIDFVGFVNIQGERTEGIKNVTITDTFGGSMVIPSNTPEGTVVENHVSVNIPVGVYDCTLSLIGILKPTYTNPNQMISAKVGFGYTNNYSDSLAVIETNRILIEE